MSHDAGVDAPHSPGGWGSPAGPWGPRGPAPGPQHQGGGGPPDGRSLAHSAHSQAAEKARGNRCHLGPSHKKDPRGEAAERGKRVRRDWKATVNRGPCARGGRPRGAPKASAHDLGGKAQYLPCGIVAEETAQLSVTCGSSAKTSDGIVATLAAWWPGRRATEPGGSDRVQLKRANGSASSGVRTPLLPRMVPCADQMGNPIHRL